MAKAPSSFYERNWKPVDLGALRSGGRGVSAGAATADFSSVNWYNRLMKNPGKRQQSLRRYDMMDETVDISRALDIMAEDISSDNIESDDIFICDYPEDSNIQSGVIKAVAKAKDLWKERTEFDIRFFDYIREMLQYGSVFFLINQDFSLTKLVAERIEGYILDNENDNKVVSYLYNEAGQYTNEAGDQISLGDRRDRQKQIPVSNLLILKIGEGPYGQSILDKVYRTWRHIQLIEDAIIIYRIVRAPERRIFYIDTGRQPAHKAEAYIERIKKKMRQKQIQRENVVETEYNPTSIQEDYFIAQSPDGRSSKVETLPGGQNLDQIKDLVYFNKKLALGLRIPMSYLMSAYDDGGAQPVYNDGKTGTAYIEELRYAGYILRIQKKITKGLFKHFKMYAASIDLKLPPELEFKISEPQSFAIYRENDLFSTLLQTVNSALSVSSLSVKKVLEKFLHFSKDDLVDNEQKMLRQKGLTDDVIETLTESQIEAIVYGGHEAEEVTGQTTGIRPPAVPPDPEDDDTQQPGQPPKKKDDTKPGKGKNKS